MKNIFTRRRRGFKRRLKRLKCEISRACARRPSPSRSRGKARIVNVRRRAGLSCAERADLILKTRKARFQLRGVSFGGGLLPYRRAAELHDARAYARHRRSFRHVAQHDAVRPNLRIRAYRYRAEQLCAAADENIVAERRVALVRFFVARRAERGGACAIFRCLSRRA